MGRAFGRIYLHPESAVGGLSALFYYSLADQVPQQTWVIVPPNKRVSSKNYHLIRTKTPLKHGIVEHDGFRIVSIERAIAEGLSLPVRSAKERRSRQLAPPFNKGKRRINTNKAD